MPLCPTLNRLLTEHYAQLWCLQFKQKDENCKGSSAIHEKNERELKREALAG